VDYNTKPYYAKLETWDSHMSSNIIKEK